MYVYITTGYGCQLIGIPMGSDVAPFMENLFLYYCERKRLLETIKTRPGKSFHIFKYFSFIDDQCTFRNDEFEKNYKVFIMRCWNSRGKIKIIVKPCFLTF